MIAEQIAIQMKTRRGAQQAYLSGRFHLSLVEQLQSELNLSRIIGGIASRPNSAEVGGGKVAGVADRDDSIAAEVRSIEVWMVKNVEELRPELQGESFGEFHLLEQREVKLMEPRSYSRSRTIA